LLGSCHDGGDGNDDDDDDDDDDDYEHDATEKKSDYVTKKKTLVNQCFSGYVVVYHTKRIIIMS